MNFSPPSDGTGQVGSPGSEQTEQWIAAARTGSRSALGRCFEASRKYLLMVATRSLDQDMRGKIGASDLVQDTFVEAQGGFPAFRGTTEEELFAWLTGIMANRLSNNVRHYRYTQKRTVDREIPAEALERVLAELSDPMTPSALVIARDEEQRVQWAMSELDEDRREILILRTWERKSFEEIGALRNCSAEAARKQWGRAVRHLEQVLKRKI